MKARVDVALLMFCEREELRIFGHSVIGCRVFQGGALGNSPVGPSKKWHSCSSIEIRAKNTEYIITDGYLALILQHSNYQPNP